MLAAIVPDDADPDPTLPQHDFAGAREARVLALYQAHWRAFGEWRADAWQLDFVVTHEGAIIGVQQLEANDFARRRSVETASWLEPSRRGRGFGTEMRAAVLHLAFDALGAEFATSDALEDNAASLGVSRSLGYEPNGCDVHVHARGTGTMLKLRLTRERWAARAALVPVTVEGLDPARVFFGA